MGLPPHTPTSVMPLDYVLRRRAQAMAIYHLAVKSVSRSTGRSAVAAAAYRSGARIENERDGLVHDYRGRGGVEAAFIVTPEGAEWAQDRSALWNAVEAAEKRKDAKTAREYELALPAELDAGQRRELVEAFARDLVQRYGVAVDAAIHEPHDYGDDRNHHAHVLTTTRAVGPDRLGAKTRQLDVRSTASVEVEALRETWAGMVNQALERAGRDERVDHRSYARQGVGIEPTVKLGHASAALERRAQRERPAGEKHQAVTVRGMFNEMVRESRRAREYIERGREWLRSVGERMRSGSELAARSMTGLVQGAARVARAELDRGGGAGMVPAIGVEAHSRERTPASVPERQTDDRIQAMREQDRNTKERGGHGR
jgi:hypothetical protein